MKIEIYTNTFKNSENKVWNQELLINNEIIDHDDFENVIKKIIKSIIIYKDDMFVKFDDIGNNKYVLSNYYDNTWIIRNIKINDYSVYENYYDIKNNIFTLNFLLDTNPSYQYDIYKETMPTIIFDNTIKKNLNNNSIIKIELSPFSEHAKYILTS